MRVATWLPLAMMGAAATVDRLLLATYGHSSFGWAYVYGAGYTILVWLTVQKDQGHDRAIAWATQTMAAQYELIRLQQTKIEELTKCLSES